jgi:TonB family protein
MKSTLMVFLFFALTGFMIAQTNDPSNQGPAKASSPSAPAVPDSTKLELLEHPLAYPPEAKEKGIQGQVIVSVSVSATGDVTAVEPVSGDPILSRAAVDAVKVWKFKPYIKDGKPIRVTGNLPLNFELPGAESLEPEPVTIVKAHYPDSDVENGIQGQVVIRAHITESGDVDNVELVKSTDKSLDKAAMDAVRQWKFKPLIANGKAISVWTTISSDFAFSGNLKNKIVVDAPAQTNTATSLRVGQGVAAGMLVHTVAPVYPAIARLAHIQGIVKLEAVINKEGKVDQLTPISGNSMLIPPAIGAVQQWRYRPYILNGEPIEVRTEITVIFSLGN